MAVPRNRSNKLKINLPPHYYEGFVMKKGPREKNYKKYWAGLRGLNLYFYNTNRDVQYVEKLDLSDFVSITNDISPTTTAMWSTEGTGATLKMKQQEVKLKMESLESREMWKGFILTMVEMKVPTTLNLLPGHIYMLSEALEKEKERRSEPELVDPRDAVPYREENKALPHCFFKVSRTEAELLLEKNENCGNMLLRPGGDGKSISVTTRQEVNGTAIIKHYKINQVGGEYIIDVEEPYRCSSLNNVVEFFITHSKLLLIPLCLDESYSMTLEVMELDKESGETTALHHHRQAVLPRLPQKSVLVGEKVLPLNSCHPVAPPPPIPPVSRVKPPVPVLSMKPENVYEEEDQPDQTYMNEDVCEIRQSFGDAKGSPIVTPRNVSTNFSQRKINNSVFSRGVMTLPRSSSADMSEELKQKLEERRAILQD